MPDGVFCRRYMRWLAYVGESQTRLHIPRLLGMEAAARVRELVGVVAYPVGQSIEGGLADCAEGMPDSLMGCI
jgi:hypothetical protein